MRGLLAAFRWELRFQLRALRTRAVMVAYVLLCSVPGVMIVVLDKQPIFGAPAFFSFHIFFQPFLTVLVAAVLAGYRSDAASQHLMWSVLGSARISSGHYLLGRWLAMASLTVSISIFPMLISTGLCAATGRPLPDPQAWFHTWLLLVVPLAIFVTAAWLGAVTITGSEIAAIALLWIGGGAVLLGANEILARFGLFLDPHSEWLLFDLFAIGRQQFAVFFYNPAYLELLAATEGAWDGRAAFEMWWPTAVPWMVASFGLLTCAVFWVARTRRDIRPRPVRPDHPLRTYLPMLHRLRQRIVPGAAPSRSDGLLAVCGVALTLLVFGGVLKHQKAILQIADERYDAEVGDDIVPMPKALESVAWNVSGTLGEYGAVALEVSSRLRNTGEEPQNRLTFVLNEALVIDEVSADERSLSLRRFYDRVEVEVDPPAHRGRIGRDRMEPLGRTGNHGLFVLVRSPSGFCRKVGPLPRGPFPA